ncbi:MAG: SDR family NAD(P)-dependent oxidoreductase, partial [Rhabdochlamydiaceae bacterium]
MQRLKEKVAIVTGASRGIGRSIARAYAVEGANLIVTGRTAKDLDTLLDEIRKNSNASKALSVPGSVLLIDDVKRAVEVAVRQFGRIDILVNNAGIPGPVKELEYISESEWDEVMETNVKGFFLFAREILPHMVNQL